MTADTINKKKVNPVVLELFIRGAKLNVSIIQTNFYARFYHENFK